MYIIEFLSLTSDFQTQRVRNCLILFPYSSKKSEKMYKLENEVRIK